MHKKNTLLIITGLLLLMTACPPSPGTDPPTATNPPAGELPAVNITAFVSGFTVELSWINPGDLAGFDVYMQEGDGEFTLAAAMADSSNSYTDTACNCNTPLVYYLVLHLAGGETITSNKSDSVQIVFTPPVVAGVRVDRLQATDRIHITWNAVAGAEKYLVYRYTGKAETDRDYTFESMTNVLDNMKTGEGAALINTPYYYKVACVMHNTVSAPSANFVEGIYSSRTDTFEPNEDKLHPSEIGSETVTALLYSFFNDGAAQDVDWYQYTGKTGLLKITVTLPAGSPLAGNAYLEIDEGNKTELNAGVNSLGYSGDMPFKVCFKLPDIEYGIGEYDIKVEEL